MNGSMKPDLLVLNVVNTPGAGSTFARPSDRILAERISSSVAASSTNARGRCRASSVRKMLQKSRCETTRAARVAANTIAAMNASSPTSSTARNDAGGDYPIRIYTIGMGDLVRYQLGTRREKPEDILKRISNDRSSLDFNNAQLEGKYFFAQTAADVGAAYQGIQNQILRLSK